MWYEGAANTSVHKYKPLILVFRRWPPILARSREDFGVSTEIETRILAFYNADIGSAFWENGFVDIGVAVEDEYEVGGGVEGVGYEELQVYAREVGFGVGVAY